MPDRHDQIISAAASLLGIALLIITGLQVAHRTETIADEIAWVAAVAFSASILIASLGQRSKRRSQYFTTLADWCFLGGVVMLFGAVLIFAARSA